MAKTDKKKHKKPTKKPNINFIAGVLEEIKNVTWPTRAETIQLTFTVLIISLIVGLFVGIIDISLTKVLELLSG